MQQSLTAHPNDNIIFYLHCCKSPIKRRDVYTKLKIFVAALNRRRHLFKK